MQLRDAFDVINDHVSDPRTGLGSEVFHFVSSLVPMVNVDLLVKNNNGEKLLTWRDDQFYGAGWHLPGGVVRFKEDPLKRVSEVAKIEIGCDVEALPDPIRVLSLMTDKRDTRGHFISLLYSVRLKGLPDLAKKADPILPFQGFWMWHSKAPIDLIPAHNCYRDLLDV